MIINTVPNMDLSESVVRLGTREDASLLADLGTRTFRESSPNTLREDLDSYLKENFTCEKLLAYLSVKSAAALILEKSGRTIGYALLYPGQAPDRLVPPHSIQLERLYILEEWIGRRLGDVLMARCLEHVRHSGFGSIWLTVWENNRRAIRFYERWGFRRAGVCDFVVGREIQKDFLLLKDIHLA
jgi:ribosomal protein S18 acetylase RimI-like enzyme